ncbi:MAG: glycosyltransferase family 2 protein [Rhodoferax sp.]|jgi:GT2 family glycosyltransferase|nr:glycosyltransferase family 2 protein [Rhodoferax sp.]
MKGRTDSHSPLRVAVVIVTYRSAALTVDCLRSLQSERLNSRIDITAVVVDNASGDYPEIAAAITREGWSDWAKLIEAPRNGGFAYGNNLGFAHAVRLWSPHYLHMLNPDTRVKPGAVRELVDFLERTPAAGIAGSSFENGDGSDWPIAFRFGSPLSELESGLGFGPVSRLLQRWRVARVMGNAEQQIDWCAGASMMLRRSMLAKIGGMDECFFLYFEETEFCWRARRAGFQTWYVPSSRVIHIAGQSTKLTERDAAPKRLPDYWFESRRRYFQVTLGLRRALLTDLLTLAAGALGQVKLTLQGRRAEIVPQYLSGVWRHSVLHRRNRDLAAPLTPRLAAD